MFYNYLQDREFPRFAQLAFGLAVILAYNLSVKKTKPLIAITLGDPAGIGPEIIAGAWTETVIHEWCQPVVVGRPEIMRRAVELWQTGLKVVEIDSPEEAQPTSGVIPCITCHEYPGHTELLAHVCGVDDYAMMLYLGPSEELLPPFGLAVVHVTLHTAMKNVFAQLTEEAILAKARLADKFMTRLMESEKGSELFFPHNATKRHPLAEGKKTPQKLRPRIGVCALNPHGGEGGLFGDEEQTVIRPAVERGLAEGLRLEGPLSTDTLMVQARDGRFDAVVAMYHDQGHIALKLLGMHRAVNVTLGLPIIRTSVAHGTAFDIAWRRQAETSGMIEALRVASRLAMGRNDER